MSLASAIKFLKVVVVEGHVLSPFLWDVGTSPKPHTFDVVVSFFAVNSHTRKRVLPKMIKIAHYSVHGTFGNV